MDHIIIYSTEKYDFISRYSPLKENSQKAETHRIVLTIKIISDTNGMVATKNPVETG
jgi:hypothetical protein